MLRQATRISQPVFGPMDFWRQVGSLMNLARLDGRTYLSRTTDYRGRTTVEDAPWLTYEEWDVVFDSAVESGVMAVIDDGNGNPTAQFANPLGPAMGLLRLWRAMQHARAKGIAPRDFAVRLDAMIESETTKTHEQARESARVETARREAAADDLRTRRNEKRTKVRDFKQEAAGGF